jgi:hypothetical protein
VRWVAHHWVEFSDARVARAGPIIYRFPPTLVQTLPGRRPREKHRISPGAGIQPAMLHALPAGERNYWLSSAGTGHPISL